MSTCISFLWLWIPNSLHINIAHIAIWLQNFLSYYPRTVFNRCCIWSPTPSVTRSVHSSYFFVIWISAEMQFNISLFVLREHISSRHPCQWTWLWLWIRLRYFYRWWGRIIANKMLRLQFFDPKIPAMRSIQNHFETSETNSACLVKSLNPEKNVEHQKSYTISTSTSPRKTRGGEMKSAHTHARTHVDPQKSNRLIGFLKLFHVNCWNAANLPIGREHK